MLQTYYIKTCQECGKKTATKHSGRLTCSHCKSEGLDYGYACEAVDAKDALKRDNERKNDESDN